MLPDAVNANEIDDHHSPTDFEFLEDTTAAGPDEENNGDMLSIPATSTPTFSAEETQELQKHLNDQLETCMSNYRSKVKHFFKEFVVFHEEAKQVVESWKTPFENQVAEENRLDTVEGDVEQTMQNIPWMNNGNARRDY